MTRWSSEDLTRGTGGVLRRPFGATGVAIDSRRVQPGDLFVALATATGDGHAHVADALARGAAGAMVHALPDGVADDAPLLQVADTQDGLWALGRFARARFQGRVVAVTGSVGKTTTKEMLRRICAAFGPTWAAEASHNNHWGVPLTLARVPPRHAYAVCEIGTNHPGEIAPLARLAQPHVAAVTVVGDAHIGHFADQAALRAEKFSIVEGLAEGGRAVLPTTQADVWDIGGGRTARLRDAAAQSEHVDVAVEVAGQVARLRLASPGRHMARNAVVALGCAAALGLDVARAAAALDGFAPMAGRGERRVVSLPDGTATLLDESYNASPAAVRAALSVLALQPGRHVAALGDMLELGEHGPSLHAGLAPDIVEARAVLFACGSLMRGLFDAVPAEWRGGYAEDSAALAGPVRAALRAGDTVLVKGSLGSRMQRVVAAIEAG